MNHDRRTPTPLLRPHFATSFRNGCSVGSMKTTNLALGIAALALVEARRAWRAESLADTCWGEPIASPHASLLAWTAWTPMDVVHGRVALDSTHTCIMDSPTRNGRPRI